jgi:hypothetical protein
MRKHLITSTAESIRTRRGGWLDVERAAVLEVTSEDKDFPVESAFVSGDARGWRAAAPGTALFALRELVDARQWTPVPMSTVASDASSLGDFPHTGAATGNTTALS